MDCGLTGWLLCHGQLSGDPHEFWVPNCEEVIEEPESWWDVVPGEAELNE